MEPQEPLWWGYGTESPSELRGGFSCSKIWLSYKSNVIASWMHLDNCRCFQEHLRMLLQGLGALCIAPGGSGSIWKYLEELVRSPGMFSRFACGFPTTYILLMFFWLLSSTSFTHIQFMDTQTPQQGQSVSESSQTTDASSNVSLAVTLQQRRHQLVHCEAPNVAIINRTQGTNSNIVHKTGSTIIMMHHGLHSEYIQITVHGGQLMIYCAARMWREPRDYFLTSRNGKPPWSTVAFIRTVCKIEHG